MHLEQVVELLPVVADEITKVAAKVSEDEVARARLEAFANKTAARTRPQG